MRVFISRLKYNTKYCATVFPKIQIHIFTQVKKKKKTENRF